MGLASFAVGCLFPQPRCSYVIFVFLQYIVYSHIARPTVIALGYFIFLKISLNSKAVDGQLSFFPEIIDFMHVGVKTADFLTWRLHRVVKEEMIMKQVHNGEFAAALKAKLGEKDVTADDVAAKKKGKKDNAV